MHVGLDPKWANCGSCGCIDGQAAYERWQLGDWKSSRCPRRAVSPESRFWLDLYSHYAKGHLYASGGVSDQPAVYLDVMALISSYVSEAQDDD